MTIWTPDLSNYKNARYQAIADEIERGIKQGSLNAGDKLPTHRALADQLSVTIGTVTRGYAEAEKRGVVTARVGRGTFIRSDEQDRGFAILAREQRNRIDFTQNLPIPMDTDRYLQMALREVAEDVPNLDLVGYQPEKGVNHQREWAAQWLQGLGVNCVAEDLTITCGGQHGISLALAATLRPGEHLLCEGLTYPGLSAIAAQMGIKLTGVEQDEQGIIPESLEEHCKAGHFRALYCTPVAQNPTNSCITAAHQTAIAEIAERYHLWIIEDAVSAYYCKDKPPSFYNLNPEISLYINSHSKMLAGGLRVGYLVTPPRLKQQVAAAIRSHCWFTSPITVEVAQRWISSEHYARCETNIREELASRVAAARRILAGCNCRILDGSFHVWLALPEPWRAADFEARLNEKGVGLLSSEPFAVGRFAAPQNVRICLSAPVALADVENGLEIIREELDSGVSNRLYVF